MADELVLTCGIDGAAALKDLNRLKRDIQRQIGGAFAQAMNAATRSPSATGLQAIGGASQRAAASVDAVALSLRRASVQQAELEARIRRGLAEQTRQNSQLTAAAAAFDRYRTAISAAGVSQNTMRMAAQDLRADLVMVKDDIIVANRVLKNWDETAKNTRKLGSFGIAEGGGNMLRSSAVNFSQSFLAAGASLTAFTQAAMIQLPEAAQAFRWTSLSASLAFGGISAAALVATPYILDWIARTNEADRVEGLHVTSLSLLEDALKRVGDRYSELSGKAKSYLETINSASLGELKRQRANLLDEIGKAAADEVTLPPADRMSKRLRDRYDALQRLRADAAADRDPGALVPFDPGLDVERLLKQTRVQEILARVEGILDKGRSLAEAAAEAGLPAGVLQKIGAEQAEQLQRLQDEIFKREEAAKQLGGQPTTEHSARIKALKEELRIQQALVGIADPIARARKAAELSATAEGRQLGLNDAALREHVDTAMALHDVQASIAANDQARADALKAQGKELKELHKIQDKLDKAAERMTDHLLDAGRELDNRITALEAKKDWLRMNLSVGRLETRFREVDMLEQIGGRLDLAGDPELKARFKALIPDIKQVARSEHAFSRVVDVMRQAEPAVVALNDDMIFMRQAFEAGDLSVGQFARGMSYLTGRMRELQEQSREAAAEAERLRLEEAAAGGSWGAGLTLASRDFMADTTDTYQASAAAFQTVTNGMADGFAEFTTTGKLAFRDFSSSLLGDMSRLMARMAAMQLMMLALRAISGAPPVPPGSTATPATHGYDPSTGMVGGAQRGRVIDQGRFTAFQRGGALSHEGRAIMQPTVFPMRNGMGLAGENRRPEAVFPLHRNSRGQLGLAVSNGSGGGSVSVNNNVKVTVEGGSGMSEAEAARIGKMIGNQIDRKIERSMLEQARPGGVLHRRYG